MTNHTFFHLIKGSIKNQKPHPTENGRYGFRLLFFKFYSQFPSLFGSLDSGQSTPSGITLFSRLTISGSSHAI